MRTLEKQDYKKNRAKCYQQKSAGIIKCNQHKFKSNKKYLKQGGNSTTHQPKHTILLLNFLMQLQQFSNGIN